MGWGRSHPGHDPLVVAGKLGAFHVIRFIGSWKNTRSRRNRAARKVPQLESCETFDAKGRKIAVFVIAYNAEAEIEETLARIPSEVRDQISELFVVDDCSPDQSYEAALRYKALQREHRMTVLRNSRNQGYGGIRKSDISMPLAKGMTSWSCCMPMASMLRKSWPRF